MKLNSIYLKNYRCFDDQELSLHEQMTVIVAENGQGKSTVLDAIRVGLWPFISGFDLARSSRYNDPQNGISISDVRQIHEKVLGMKRQLPSSVSPNVEWGALTDTLSESNISLPGHWQRYREKEKSGTKTLNDNNAKKLEKSASQLQQRIRQPGDCTSLPVFGYYGTGRLWQQKRLMNDKQTKADKNDASIRTFAYRHCMDPASSYKYFSEWFISAWKSRTNMNERKSATDDDRQHAEARIKVVQSAIDSALEPTTGWNTLEFSIEDQESLVLNHREKGYLSVDQLSDGIRSVLALVGDLAHRCIRLNPHLGTEATIQTAGIVLIDEIDMHLHPRWQQRILQALQNAFPAIQFVVTTHSPQVITTATKEQLRIIREVDQQLCITQPDYSPLAHESGDALAYVMNVNPRPELPKVQKFISDYEQLVRSGQEESRVAQAIKSQLDSSGYQISDSDIETWRFLATFQKEPN